VHFYVFYNICSRVEQQCSSSTYSYTDVTDQTDCQYSIH